jgi:hypothetical protein
LAIFLAQAVSMTASRNELRDWIKVAVWTSGLLAILIAGSLAWNLGKDVSRTSWGEEIGHLTKREQFVYLMVQDFLSTGGYYVDELEPAVIWISEDPSRCVAVSAQPLAMALQRLSSAGNQVRTDCAGDGARRIWVATTFSDDRDIGSVASECGFLCAHGYTYRLSSIAGIAMVARGGEFYE